MTRLRAGGIVHDRRPRMAIAVAFLLLSWMVVFTAQAPPPRAPGSPVPGIPMPDAGGAVPPRDSAGTPPTAGTAVIRGRVVAADSGQPLLGVQIDASTPALLRAGADRRTTTDEEGRFEIAGLPAGRYSLSASKAGYVTLRFGQRGPLDAGEPIDVTDGAIVSDASFALRRGGVIAGHVVDVNGDPLSGVRVQAGRYRYAGGRYTFARIPGEIAFAYVSSTDDRGAFRIHGLPPGEYVVIASARAEQLSAPDGQGYARTFSPGVSPARAGAMALREGQERTVAIQMIPSPLATVSGVALDADGRPYTGASVSLLDVTTGDATVGVPVGPAGSFSMSRVGPGEYVLIVRASGNGSPSGRVPIVVDGADLAGLVVRASRPFPARGRIVDPSGRPPDGLATAAVGITARALPLDTDGTMVFGSIADDWTFEVPNLQGAQLVRATVSSLSSGWTVGRIMHQGQDVTDSALDFSRGPIEDLVIEVTRMVTSIGGAVRDARGGIPREAVVLVFAEDPARWTSPSRFIHMAWPDRTGAFFVRALPPGEYIAVAVDYLEPGRESHPPTLDMLRRAAAATRVSLREGQTGRADLQLWDGF